MTTLDFGCGMGLFAISMARLVGDRGRVVAIDLQQQMLNVLQKRARRAGVTDRIQTLRCEANSIGFDEPIDFALAFYSAHEVPDQKRLLGEIHGCLRPGGRLLIAEPIGHVTAADFQRTLSLADEIGLSVEERPRIRLSRAAVLAAQ
jgi:ubiquinone/menaquinone biosynthesis C-methylase UbiE